jgi:hypothetical protein
MLPDEVSLEIFDFCTLDLDGWLYAWQTLVHVCRQWRCVVFGSPLRLNLQLVCSTETPARDALNIWPSLPLLIYANGSETLGMDNVVAALDRSDRVREISISISRSQSAKLWKAMQEPLPELTYLVLERMMKVNRYQSFPIRSWVDLHHVCNHLNWNMFHSRDYRNFFCPPLTSPNFPFRLFLLPDTFHPRRWLQAFPH